jgi:hypothetical protein
MLYCWDNMTNLPLQITDNAREGERVNTTLTLNQILALVGKLDDTEGDETPRERFRRFLQQNVCEIGQIQDYVEECLRNSGDQYNRALQDLVNHLGRFLGFKVTFGRYQGVRGKIGFDGHWISPTGFHIVGEVKTTDAYAIKTNTLVGYVDELISEKQVSSWDQALGLYIVGRPDSDLRQLENAIVAERRTHQLRVISTESLLSLVEMMNEYKITHEEILPLLRPSGPRIDPIVDLMARLIAERRVETLSEPTKELQFQEPTRELPSQELPEPSGAVYWLTPVKSDEKDTAEEVIKTLVGKERAYAFGDGTPGRKIIKPGDSICFYATGKGIIAHAQVISRPENNPYPFIRHPEKYPWTFRLDKAVLYLNTPVAISADTRNKLDAFQERDPNKSWAWFVQATHKLTEHDFNVLTRR